MLRTPKLLEVRHLNNSFWLKPSISAMTSSCLGDMSRAEPSPWVEIDSNSRWSTGFKTQERVKLPRFPRSNMPATTFNEAFWSSTGIPRIYGKIRDVMMEHTYIHCVANFTKWLIIFDIGNRLDIITMCISKIERIWKIELFRKWWIMNSSRDELIEDMIIALSCWMGDHPTFL